MISANEFVKALSLTVLVPARKEGFNISSAELNRPGMQFSGYYEYFAYERPQVIGKVEMAYLDSLDDDLRYERLRKYFSYPIPCIIISRGMTPPREMVQLAQEHDVPIYGTNWVTTRLFVNAITYLNHELAPRSTVHGVLVDVYGIGVMLTGDSGVGKSEAALELVKRGHQLVADDVVDIRKVNDNRLTGEAPETIRHFMEIRGIGIIDIRAMFGVGAVLMSKSIDMVIHLELWEENKVYDRLGLNESYTTIMGVKVPEIVLPVRPGRNLAVVIEVAARNLSLKKLGYSAAHELDRRLNDMMNHNA
ncbi:MAG: HPr kinase/phosphorylase [Clostridia bacterium]|nr:HPr kinase/phosphorylase [Clostridia bacterium]